MSVIARTGDRAKHLVKVALAAMRCRCPTTYEPAVA